MMGLLAESLLGALSVDRRRGIIIILYIDGYVRAPI